MDETQLVRVDYNEDPITCDPEFRRKVGLLPVSAASLPACLPAEFVVYALPACRLDTLCVHPAHFRTAVGACLGSALHEQCWAWGFVGVQSLVGCLWSGWMCGKWQCLVALLLTVACCCAAAAVCHATCAGDE